MNKKAITKQEEWGAVLKELENENFKLASYDNTLISAIGDIIGKKILDYGAGPGILALVLQKMGAEVKVWDINHEMRDKSAEKIGRKNIYSNINKMSKNYFDIIICNLVLCIISETEVRNLLNHIINIIKRNGVVYIGFCNPKIFSIKESNLDFRFPNGNQYEDNHDYKKIKKEGGYEIIESHRPIEWYKQIFNEAGFNIIDILLTPEYSLKGERINDFIIFKLNK